MCKANCTFFRDKLSKATFVSFVFIFLFIKLCVCLKACLQLGLTGLANENEDIVFWANQLQNQNQP